MNLASISENRDIEKRIAITPEIAKKYIKKVKEYFNFLLKKAYLHINEILYKASAGDYCESVIPDPIPNSEVKPFCADGTLS